MKSLSRLPVVRSCRCEPGPAPDRAGGGGASRVAASGPRAATKEPVGERRGPTPARLHPDRGLVTHGPLRASSYAPTEPSTSLRQRHSPDACFLSLEVVPPAALIGLVNGLPADPEGLPDLGPGRAVAACCVGQQIAYICECVLGVSHLPQSVQWPLGAAQGPAEVLDHPTGPHPRVGALFGAHVNGCWQQARTPECITASTSVALLMPANSGKHSISGKEVNGAPSGDISTPGDYVRPRDPIFGSIQPKKETPQERQLLGAVDDIRGN